MLALARYAVKKRLLSDEPECHPTTLPRRVPKCLTVDEFNRLIAACAATGGTIDQVPASTWWLSLVLVLFDTAERIGAILPARWDWFDGSGRWLTVPAEVRKGHTADRVYPLRESTIRVLDQLRDYKRQTIWHWPYTDVYLYTHFHNILKRAGLDENRVGFHLIRRTAASHFEAAGGNATELLDHSKRSITKRSYLDPRIVTQQHAIDLLFEPTIPERAMGPKRKAVAR